MSWFEDEYSGELKHPAMKAYTGELDANFTKLNQDACPERLKRVGDQIRQELKATYGLTAKEGPSDKARRKTEIRRPSDCG